MKSRKKGLQHVWGFAAAIMVMGLSGSSASYALIDETNSVYIDASEIENATLIIGTHLIYLDSMNEQIYEAAMESAEEANQYSRYYKSELAGGVWYEITDAGTLADITTDGIVVEDRVIEALFMTHHTRSDGITYDLRNGGSVSIYDINDPYNLEEMSEMEPIKLQYDVLAQTEEPSDTMERDMDYIEEIYRFDRETDTTRDLEQKLDALQRYYEVLVRDGADSGMSDMVMSVMEKLDAARRVEVLTSLNDYQLQKMSQVVGREFTYLPGEITGVYTIAEEREKNAGEASEEAESQVREEFNETMSELKSELADLRTDLEAAVAKVEKSVKDKYDDLIAAAPDEGEGSKTELTEQMNAEINEAMANDADYIDLTEAIKKKEAQINSAENALDGDIEKAVSEAREEEMNRERDVVENFAVNNDLLTAIEEAMTNVQESYSNYSSKMLAEGTTVLSRAEYRFANDLISSAQGNNYGACDAAVKNLIYIDRINNNIIREEDAERSFLEQELLEAARKSYSASIGAGAGEAYRTLSTMAAAATQANVLKNQLNETETVRNELQFIMQAYIDRLPTEDALKYISDCLDGIDSYQSAVKADAYEAYAVSSVDSYMDWLAKTIKNLQDLAGGSALDDLNQKKKDLQTERMCALDNNRLDQAKKIEVQIEAIDKEIEETEEYLNSVLNSELATESEKVLAAAQLGEGSASDTIQNLKDTAVEDIRNGNLDGVTGILDGIQTLAEEQPEGAAGALKDVYQELIKQELMGTEDSALDQLMSQIEELTAEQRSTGSDISEDVLAALIQEYVRENMTVDSDDDFIEDSGEGQKNDLKLEKIMSDLTGDQIGVVLAGLSMYAEETGNQTAQEVVATYSKFAFQNGNKYVYEQLKNELFEFVPTDKLSQVMGYRYIFNDSQKSVTLQKGSGYYKFDAFSNMTEKAKEVQEMTRAAAFQGVIYIPEDIVQEYFTLEAEYLNKTTYGVILTEAMQRQVQQFLEYLLESGEEF